ncbi:MAG: enoyl-CoA hydratase [Halioglobus sp.]|nr:enoyl-CoA hydratase [Halioglobus sp.]
MHTGTDIEEIAVEFEAGVLQIRINRPHKKNALHGPMYTRMADLLEEAGRTQEVRVIYITGSPDCFSSGNDVSTFGADDATSADELPAVRFLRTIAHSEVPIVAAVNGPAIGVGTTMLMHCDVVIAGEDAVFQTPFVDLGVSPEAASSFLMPLRLGYLRAAEMLLQGEAFDAQKASDCGLVNRVCDSADYQREALATAQRLAAAPPTSLRATKRVLRAPLIPGIEEAMGRENAEFARCMESPEFAEAITAFMERRPADFGNC